MSKEEVWVNQVGQMVIYEEGLSYEYLTLSYIVMFLNKTIENTVTTKTAKTITSSCIELNIYKWLKDNEYEFVGYL